jgi:integrase
MPKLITRPPKYARHKASGQAVVKVNRRLRYLGPWNFVESKVKYQEALSEWSAEQGTKPAATTAPVLPESDITMVELLNAYLVHAQTYCVKDGQQTTHVHVLRCVIRVWKKLFGAVLVRNIKPFHLKAIQNQMVADKQSRGYVNKITSCSKTMFRWAVENDLCPAPVWQGLLAVRGLVKGRTKARETKPVEPVDDAVVEATAPYLPEIVADMVQLQRLTGARPSEVCAIRPCDVDRSGDVWLYRPQSHKTEHHGRGRVIAIGPRAQDVLRTYLLRESTAHCFSPQESEVKRNAGRRETRKTPLTPSQAARKPKRHPRRPKGDKYTKDSYRRCISRAVELANEERRQAGLDPLQDWHPNQLRHSLGTDVRKRFGLEAAQVVLGHSKANTTEIYAARDLQKAMEVARQVG